MSEERIVETRARYYQPQEFIDDPTLFGKVEEWWRAKNWFALVGEWPIDGRCFAVIPNEGGVIFWWRHRDDT